MSIALIINSPLMILSSSGTLYISTEREASDLLLMTQSSNNIPLLTNKRADELSFREKTQFIPKESTLTLSSDPTKESTLTLSSDPTAEILRFKEKRKQQRDTNPYLLTLKEKIESPPLQPSEKVSTELLDSIRAQLPLWFMHNRTFKQTVRHSTKIKNKQEEQVLQLSSHIKPSPNPKIQSRSLRMLLLQHQEDLLDLEENIAEAKATKDTDFAIIKALALQLPLSIQPKTDIELDFIQTLGKILKEHSLYAKYIYEKNMYTELTKNNKPAQKINFAWSKRKNRRK